MVTAYKNGLKQDENEDSFNPSVQQLKVPENLF